MRHFVEELEDLQGRLLEMGTLVESAIHQSVQALVERSEELARQVLGNEDRINHLEIEIDELAVRLQVENVARARVKSRRFAPIDLLRPVLPQVKAPLGGIWGERDATAYPYVEERRDFLRAIQPHAPFDIIADAGHWVMYEAAQPFNEALLAQLAKTERAEAVRA